jgi:hypothetical protein
MKFFTEAEQRRERKRNIPRIKLAERQITATRGDKNVAGKTDQITNSTAKHNYRYCHSKEQNPD